jgi:undecaprenyl-diphosphatase
VTRQLRRALVTLVVLSLGFVTYSGVVALGDLRALDDRAMLALQGFWLPNLVPLFQGIAVLGGIEVAVALSVGLALYLWRSGFRQEAWVVLALPLLTAVELVYKRLLVHPEPMSQHPDGPSVSKLLGAHLLTGNSYPSGHVMRAVVVYGLLAFVIHRLSPPGWLHRLVIPAAAVMISAMAFDRVYLGVHWESDVVGGLLAGGLVLAASIAWLDRPRVAG